MRVRVRYLSTVRERTGTGEDELELPRGSTLAAVSQWLGATYGMKVPDASLMSLINGYSWSRHPEGPARELRDGDEIALFPLLSGG